MRRAGVNPVWKRVDAGVLGVNPVLICFDSGGRVGIILPCRGGGDCFARDICG